MPNWPRCVPGTPGSALERQSPAIWATARRQGPPREAYSAASGALLYAQAIETVRCMDEGVVTHAADADIGSIFGWGFPPYTGGTISYIETEGLKAFVAEADRLAQAYGDRFAVPDSLRSMSEIGESFYQLADAKEHRTAA